MVVLYTILVILSFSLVLMTVCQSGLPFIGPRRGKLPPKGRGTMFDVRHLLMEGEKELAIQLYAEIFKTTSLKAKKDVEDLARSLKV